MLQKSCQCHEEKHYQTRLRPQDLGYKFFLGVDTHTSFYLCIPTSRLRFPRKLAICGNLSSEQTIECLPKFSDLSCGNFFPKNYLDAETHRTKISKNIFCTIVSKTAYPRFFRFKKNKCHKLGIIFVVRWYNLYYKIGQYLLTHYLGTGKFSVVIG